MKFSMKLTFWAHQPAVSSRGMGKGREEEGKGLASGGAQSLHPEKARARMKLSETQSVWQS